MSKLYNFCNNCGKNGHAFHQCKYPITSIGIIAFRMGENNLEYLMIRRKDTLGYVDFIRGKYSIYNKIYIQNIINTMTNDEKKRLLTEDFNTLWNNLWGDNVGIQYRSEERTSKEKYYALISGININGDKYTLQSLIKNASTSWVEPEWGFPKGRRNYQEKDLQAAMR